MTKRKPFVPKEEPTPAAERNDLRTPWTKEKSSVRLGTFVICNATGEVIAEIYPPVAAGAYDHEQVANLIVRAPALPALLAATKAAMEWMQRESRMNWCPDASRETVARDLKAAIKQAEGEAGK